MQGGAGRDQARQGDVQRCGEKADASACIVGLMSVSPEQQLRAYVDYFRDLGVHELYRHEAGLAQMPPRWRELAAQPKPPAPQTRIAQPTGAPERSLRVAGPATSQAPTRPRAPVAEPARPAAA